MNKRKSKKNNAFRRNVAKLASTIDVGRLARELKLKPAKIAKWRKRYGGKKGKAATLSQPMARKHLQLLKVGQQLARLKTRIQKLRKAAGGGKPAAKRPHKKGPKAGGQRQAKATIKKQIAALAIHGGMPSAELAKQTGLPVKRIERFKAKFGKKTGGKSWPAAKTAKAVEKLVKGLRKKSPKPAKGAKTAKSKKKAPAKTGKGGNKAKRTQ